MGLALFPLGYVVTRINQIFKELYMSIINDINEVMHKIRVKLYPNYLPQVEGKYIARTANEAVLSVEQVCAALKNRGGFTGNYEELVECVRKFFDEAAYQLCDGFAVNTGYFSVHPNIGGTFNSAKDVHDAKKNPLSFRFRTGAKLRRLTEFISVEIAGVADTSGYIDEFYDINAINANETITANGQFIILGNKIKIAGDDPKCGIYFEPIGEPQNRIKVIAPLAENFPTKVIGLTPMNVTDKSFKVVIITQFNGSSTMMKNPREMTGNFELAATVSNNP